MSIVPMPTRTLSKASIAATEYSADSCPDRPPPVSARKARPTAVRATPVHSLRPRWKPNQRSATTPSSTSPPASTACTIESDARASAPTCST